MTLAYNKDNIDLAVKLAQKAHDAIDEAPNWGVYMHSIALLVATASKIVAEKFPEKGMTPESACRTLMDASIEMIQSISINNTTA